MAVTVKVALPTWWPATSNFVPLTVASATAGLLLITEKVRGEIWEISGIETKFGTLIGLGLV